MTRIKKTKTNFTAGEISTRLLGRGDLRAYENGALALRNLFIHPTGGVTRRYGTSYIDTARGDGRLICFEFNTDQIYLLVFTDEKIDIYRNDVLLATIDSPYTAVQIKNITWTQSADTLIICHEDWRPQELIRLSDTEWSIQTLSFFRDPQTLALYHPFHKHVAAEVTLSTNNTTGGSITVTASAPIFNSGYVSRHLNLHNGQLRIHTYVSPTQVIASRKIDLKATTATTNWKEDAFSPEFGWPVTVAFHQDRLVFGGSRSIPNRLWFSKTGDIYNFDTGNGLDDESISFGILSDQVNAITGIFSGRHLQVFTSGAEWQVTGSPLTPETVQVSRQTRVGSIAERYVPPLDVDGATMYCARNKKELREFLYSDVEGAYRSTDLALLARHIIDSPVDQAYNAKDRLLFIVMEDGSVGVLTVYRDEAVIAWTKLETEGFFRSVITLGDRVYFLVERNSGYFIEKLEKNIYTDSTLTGNSATPKTVWSGLDHLEGQIVQIVADGNVQNDKLVSSGTITLDAAASNVKIGLPYQHTIQPLPPSTTAPEGSGKAARLVESVFRVEDTSALYVDVGKGLVNILETVEQNGITFTGDKSIRAIGWTKNMTKSLWKIEQSTPLPFTLLSVTTEMKVND